MKRRKLSTRIREVIIPYASPLLVNVRNAKDRLSSLLDLAAHGQEIVIASGGHPKAKLVPFQTTQKPFRVNWTLLKSAPLWEGGKRAEEIVREDRDSRP